MQINVYDGGVDLIFSNIISLPWGIGHWKSQACRIKQGYYLPYKTEKIKVRLPNSSPVDEGWIVPLKRITRYISKKRE